MKFLHSLLFFCIVLISCTPHRVDIVSEAPKDLKEKAVVILNHRDRYVRMFERELKLRGFKIPAQASRQKVHEKVTNDKTVEYTEAEARIGITLNYSVAASCFAGGGRFNYFSAEVIDFQTNEVVLMIEDSGYSEDCPPASGRIFGKAADAVNSLWK